MCACVRVCVWVGGSVGVYVGVGVGANTQRIRSHQLFRLKCFFENLDHAF